MNGVDSRRWQDWSFGLNEPMPTVTASVTATVTATDSIVSVVTVTPPQPSMADGFWDGFLNQDYPYTSTSSMETATVTVQVTATAVKIV